MKKFFSVFLVLAIVAGTAVGQNYTFPQQPTQSQKIGFGSVIGSQGTGAVCVSSCDGMAYVNAAEACQIGTGSNVTAGSFQYRDTPILEAEGVLGITAYGNMISKYVIWDEDFMVGGYEEDAGSATQAVGFANAGAVFSEVANQAPWLVTIVDGGGDNDEVIVIDDAVNGILKVETCDAANDTVQVQLNGEPVKLTVGKKFWFKARIAVEDISEDNMAIGLTLKASTDVIGSAPADGVWFQMDNDGNLDYHVSQNSTDTTADTGVNMVDGEYVIVAFYFDGVDTIVIAVNGTTVATLVDDGVTIVFPDDEELTPFIEIETTDTGKDYALVDYIGVISER